jgi:hypothetical protein
MRFVEIVRVVVEIFTENTILGPKTKIPEARTLIFSAPIHPFWSIEVRLNRPYNYLQNDVSLVSWRCRWGEIWPVKVQNLVTFAFPIIPEARTLNISARFDPFEFSFGHNIDGTYSYNFAENQIKQMTLEGTLRPRPQLRLTKIPEARTLIFSAPIHSPGAKIIHDIVRTRTYNVLEAQLPIRKTRRVAVIGPETLNFSVRR